jgi:hypothetical protein
MRRPALIRLGMVAAIAAFGLATAAIPAGADEPTSAAPSTSASQSTSRPSSEPPSSEPSPPAEDPEDVRLGVEATFYPEHYMTGDPLAANVRITNSGSDPATGLTVEENTASTDRMVLDAPGWRSLDGVTIAPGATHELKLTGRMTNPGAGLVTLSGTLRDGSGASTPFSFQTDANDVYGSVRGVLYRDLDGDSQLDPGEAHAGSELTLVHTDHPSITHTMTTDAAGEFAADYVYTGTYSLTTNPEDGWHLSSPRRITVVEGENTPLQVRTVRRSSVLRATMTFERDTYRRDEVAALRITLTNTGAAKLTGVKVTCQGGPDRNRLAGTGWTPLTPPGTTLEPNQTRAFRVTERVPDGAFRVGLVEARCDFTDDGVTGADAADTAKVVGGIGVLHGEAFYRATDNWPEPPTNIRLLKNIRVVAVSGDHCPRYLETRTDTQGSWRFDRVPTGAYRVYAFPPADIELPPPPSAHVRHEESTFVTLEGWENSAAPPPPALPTPPPGCEGGPGEGGDGQPAPRPKPTSNGLAYTGASVVGMAAIGVAALLAGAGGILATRRHKR